MNASWVTVDTSAWLWTVHLGTSAKHADLIPPPKSVEDIVAVQVRLVKALRNVRFGSKADMCSANRHVRFTPESGHVRRNLGCPLWANSGHAATYSITSSARASSAGGTVRPRAFAVLRLIANSYLVGACTGKSAGFSLFRIRSM